MEQSSIEKLHADGSELISKHLNGEISARDFIVMYHNLYYDAREMHKQEIIKLINSFYDYSYGGISHRTKDKWIEENL